MVRKQTGKNCVKPKNHEKSPQFIAGLLHEVACKMCLQSDYFRQFIKQTVYQNRLFLFCFCKRAPISSIFSFDGAG